MDNGDISTFTDGQILDEAREKWNVYHLFPNKETRGARNYWDQALGENSIWVDSVEKIAHTIADIVLKGTINSGSACEVGQTEATDSATDSVEDSGHGQML